MTTLKRPRSRPLNESDAKRLRTMAMTMTIASPRAHATFFDLPTDIQCRIYSALSLGDLHNVRLSCMINITCPSSAIAAMVSDEFKRRRAEIQTVRSMLPAKGYKKERQVQPTEFVKIKKLRIASLPYMHRGTDMLPPGICHFGALRELHLSSSEISLGSLPDTLLNCRYMTRLFLRANHFAEFPRVILKLKRLTHLDLSHCTQMTDDIPDNIGKCLPHLKVFNIEQCTSFRHIPKSLVRTLERNLNKTNIQKQKYVPLVVSPRLFPQGYLRGCIDTRKYPKLAAKCEHIFLKNDEEQPAENEEEEEDMAGDEDDAQFEDVDVII